jgi:hypothetical protein
MEPKKKYDEEDILSAIAIILLALVIVIHALLYADSALSPDFIIALKVIGTIALFIFAVLLFVVFILVESRDEQDIIRQYSGKDEISGIYFF